jgi:hypothetical protein
MNVVRIVAVGSVLEILDLGMIGNQRFEIATPQLQPSNSSQ